MIGRFGVTAAVFSLALGLTNASAQTIDIGTNFMDFYEPEARRISVKLTEGLTNSDQLPNEHLKAVRKRLNQKKSVRYRDLQALADLGDGNAAFQLAKILDESGKPDLIGDAAHYFGIAAATDRGGAIFGMVRSLEMLDSETVSPGRLRNLRYVLLKYAKAGNSIAADALIRFHQTGHPFGSLTNEINNIVLKRGGPAVAPVALLLASEILQAPAQTEPELELARTYLRTATKATSLRVRATAENMIPVVDIMIQNASATAIVTSNVEASE